MSTPCRSASASGARRPCTPPPRRPGSEPSTSRHDRPAATSTPRRWLREIGDEHVAMMSPMPGEAGERQRVGAHRDPEARDLGEAAGRDRGLRVVAEPERVHRPGHDRHDVLQRTRELDADEVAVAVEAERRARRAARRRASLTVSRGAATTAAAGSPRAISGARFGPDSAATLPSTAGAASTMTSLIRSSEPGSMPFATDTTTASGATWAATAAVTDRIAPAGTAMTTSPSAVRSAAGSAVTVTDAGSAHSGQVAAILPIAARGASACSASRASSVTGPRARQQHRERRAPRARPDDGAGRNGVAHARERRAPLAAGRPACDRDGPARAPLDLPFRLPVGTAARLQVHARALAEHEPQRRATEVERRRAAGSRGSGDTRSGPRPRRARTARTSAARWRPGSRRRSAAACPSPAGGGCRATASDRSLLSAAVGTRLRRRSVDRERRIEDLADALAGVRADRQDGREVEERGVRAEPGDVLVERPAGLLLDEVPLVDREHEADALVDDVPATWASCAASPSVASRTRTQTSARPMALSARSAEKRSASGPEATFPRRRMPAVSTSRTVRPSHSSVVSIASRVVPGTSLTMTRSSPRSALSSDDLPTFGRPTIAMRGTRSVSSSRIRRLVARSPSPPRPRPGASAIASAWASRSFRASSSSDSAGSAQTSASSRSPVPRPWSALIAYASGQPSRWNSAPSSSRRSLSALLMTTMTGEPCGAQRLGRLLVGRRQARGCIDDEEDDVRLLDREARLLLDLLLDRVARVDLHAAGVDDDEAAIVPLGDRVEPVAGRACPILDDGLAPPDDAVEEGRLADVGPTDDGDDRAGRPVGASAIAGSTAPTGRTAARHLRPRSATCCGRRARRPR